MVENIPRRLVFRVPGISQIGVFFAFLSASVVALAGSKLLLLVYLVPIGLGIWLWRSRTVVDTERIVVRRVFTSRVIDWSTLAGLRIGEHKWVRAVLADGREVLLPSVRTRHLPVLAMFSGGRLADPTEPQPSDTSQASETSDLDDSGISDVPDISDAAAISDAAVPQEDAATPQEAAQPEKPAEAGHDEAPAPPVTVAGETGATV
ncbi:MAG TPA: PH domain-containing protein [Pseudonocardiaceae bacterium]|nr:PH domain-containing protein [Pseudonocardiaceae bacterium]